MPRVHAVITDPYFELPSWLSKAEHRETTYLSKDSNAEDVVLFLALLCGINEIDINKEPNEVIKDLVNTDKVILSGGIAFESQNNLILPSCCCGLEQWKEVRESIVNKQDAWLGHDPFPCIEYLDESVRIWSDDYFGKMEKEPPTEQEKQNMVFIEFNHNELIEKLQCVESDLLHFFKYPLAKELVMVDTDLMAKFYMKYCEWLSLEIK